MLPNHSCSHTNLNQNRLIRTEFFNTHRWDEKAGLRRNALSSQVIDALVAQEIRRPAMKKPSTMTRRRNGQLTIGLDGAIARASTVFSTKLVR